MSELKTIAEGHIVYEVEGPYSISPESTYLAMVRAKKGDKTITPLFQEFDADPNVALAKAVKALCDWRKTYPEYAE